MTQLSALPDYTGPGRLWHVPGGQPDAPPFLLTHGTFSNAAILQPIAQFLVDQGRQVFISEWRGRHGRPPNVTYHDLAEGEIAHAMQYIGRPMHLLGHSGGGLALCFAQMQTDLRALTLSLTLIATQGTHLRDAGPRVYWSIKALSVLCRLWGYWPKVCCVWDRATKVPLCWRNGSISIKRADCRHATAATFCQSSRL